MAIDKSGKQLKEGQVVDINPVANLPFHGMYSGIVVGILEPSLLDPTSANAPSMAAVQIVVHVPIVDGEAQAYIVAESEDEYREKMERINRKLVQEQAQKVQMFQRRKN